MTKKRRLVFHSNVPKELEHKARTIVGQILHKEWPWEWKYKRNAIILSPERLRVGDSFYGDSLIREAITAMNSLDTILESISQHNENYLKSGYAYAYLSDEDRAGNPPYYVYEFLLKKEILRELIIHIHRLSNVSIDAIDDSIAYTMESNNIER